MKIRIGEVYENKTKIFLVPGLKHYGNSFIERFSFDFFKLGYGIKDNLFNNNELLEGKKPIFIMIDRLVKPQTTLRALEWLKTKDFFITDYVSDLAIPPRKHIIILDYPSELKETYDNFLKGYYSKMYNEELIEKFFIKDSEAYKILKKDLSYVDSFISKIEKVFDVRITEKEKYFDSELEFPYNMNKESLKEEIFNI